MGESRQCIHRFSVEQDIELSKLRQAVAIHMVVERGIAFRDALQLVVEINYNLSQWQHEVKVHTISTDILLLEQFASLVETEFHYRTDIVGIGDYRRLDIRLLNVVYHRGIGQSRWIMHFF